MKKLLLLLFIFPFTAGSFSQSLSDKLSDALYQIGKEIPSDQLFLHLDRNLYHAGDTIRFQAYVRESRTGIFTTESSSVYALLLNSEHVTIDSARFRILYAGASGWLKVPDDIPVGDYSVLAFTSIDMNYSPEYAFNAPIKIANILPVPAKNKSKSKTGVAPLSQIPLQLPQIELRFLPEGGTFISGIHQRLAFNAVRSDGRGLEVKGVITNQSDERISEFRSSPYGPGVVEFTPKPGDWDIDSESVDMLLMTYGWRSFHPKETVIDNSEKELVNYDFLKIINEGPVKKRRSDIQLISDADADILSLPVDNKGEAELFYDSLNAGVRQIMILPDKTPAKNITPVRVLFPENKEYTDNAKLLTPDKGYLNTDLSETSSTQPGYDVSRLIVIESVTIKAPKQQPKKYEDKYAKMFQSAGTRTLTSDDYREAYSFEDILYKSNPYFININNLYIAGSGKEVYLRANEHTTVSIAQGGDATYGNKMLPALIVVDNNPIGTSYEMISTMPANEIASVTFLKGPQGFAMYGNRAAGGVVFVTTKMSAGIEGTYTDEEVKRDDDLLKQVRLFRTETEYYTPTKEEVAHLPEFQFRPTILWKADLFIDGSGPVKIKYPNNLTKGTAMVFVNGISVTNLIGSGNYSYRVQ